MVHCTDTRSANNNDCTYSGLKDAGRTRAVQWQLSKLLVMIFCRLVDLQLMTSLCIMHQETVDKTNASIEHLSCLVASRLVKSDLLA